jgi:pyrroline-5-carboxylate reductase
MEVLGDGRFRELLARAAEAARKRSRELSEE